MKNEMNKLSIIILILGGVILTAAVYAAWQ